MKETPEFIAIDLKFIQAVDEIIKINKRLGIKPNNDSAIAKAIYPPNRAIISAVRSKTKHVPHLALINLAKVFHVNMNYFYKPNEQLKYSSTNHLPEHLKKILPNTSFKNNEGRAIGDLSARHQEFTDNLNRNSPNPNVMRVVKTDTMVSSFASKIDVRYREQFLSIVSHIKAEKILNTQKMNLIVEQNAKELALLRQSYKEELSTTREELSKTVKQLTASQNRENEVLRQYIDKINLK